MQNINEIEELIKLISKFPDAELMDVKLNEKEEDKNDWFYKDFG